MRSHQKKVHLICRMQHLGNMNKEVQKFILSDELDKIINSSKISTIKKK